MAPSLYGRALQGFLRSKALIRCVYSNSLHTEPYNKKCRTTELLIPSKMKAWYLTDFNGVENLIMSDMCSPTMNSPKDVMIKVNAASLNPLDVMMSNGYGKELLGKINQLIDAYDKIDQFPLVLGRDFSGEVVDVGMDVTEYVPGDEVFGALFPSSQGSLAEYVSASEYSVCSK